MPYGAIAGERVKEEYYYTTFMEAKDGKINGKLLFIGIRNKYCHACALGGKEKNHACFRNWDASSSEMETDIVLEGFMEAERVHGVHYTQFIGDGDSSVQFSSLLFLDGARLSRNLSVQIMHANAIEVHLRSLSRITPRIKAVGGSLK